MVKKWMGYVNLVSRQLFRSTAYFFVLIISRLMNILCCHIIITMLICLWDEPDICWQKSLNISLCDSSELGWILFCGDGRWGQCVTVVCRGLMGSWFQDRIRKMPNCSPIRLCSVLASILDSIHSYSKIIIGRHNQHGPHLIWDILINSIYY